MSNKIPWQPIPEDYDFENDFEAPSKLFWCKGPYGEGYWSNDELWEDVPISSSLNIRWCQNPDLKITHWAWVNGPEKEEERVERFNENLINENPEYCIKLLYLKIKSMEKEIKNQTWGIDIMRSNLTFATDNLNKRINYLIKTMADKEDSEC